MRRQEISLSECTRQNLCCDCDNEKCALHGKKEADCPKYRCGSLDCENCDFLNEYIKEMRDYYKGKGGIFNEYELW